MMTREPPKRAAPSILAVDPWLLGNRPKGRMHQLLSEEERARLVPIASVVRFRRGAEIYRTGEPASAMFIIVSGVVKVYSGGDNHITAFLFPGDLCGLAEEGIYANSVRAVTAVTAYQLPLRALRSRLSQDGMLEYHLICKLCQDLRYSQRHAFLVAQRHADSKIATFLQMLEQHQVARGEDAKEIRIPMNRSDIAEYVGMSLAAVSRSFASLVSRGIVKNGDRHHLRIIDRDAFEKIVAGGTVRRSGRRAPSKRGAHKPTAP